MSLSRDRKTESCQSQHNNSTHRRDSKDPNGDLVPNARKSPVPTQQLNSPTGLKRPEW